MKRFACIAVCAVVAATAPRAHAQEQTTTIGGYGNAAIRWNTTHTIVNGKDTSKADNAEANIDRFVLFVSHPLTEKISFRSELEVEDTKLEAGGASGEVSVEQMYLDWSMSKGFNPRAGLILVPVGIINETHEPPTFNGNDRPQLDNEDGGIIPTTWRELGFGSFGQIADGWNYRAYLMASMLASGFSHAGGIGEGKQEGAKTNASNLALTGRVEYTGTTGLRAGLSFYYGGTSGGDVAAFGTDANGFFAIPMSVISADAQYTIGDLYLRGVWAMTSLDADKINKAYAHDTASAIAKGMGGFYLEAAYNVLKVIDNKSTGQLLPFVRYESIDLNSSLAAMSKQDNGLVKTAITAGLTYKPAYNIAVKFDWRSYSNKAFGDKVEGAASTTTTALGFGYMF